MNHLEQLHQLRKQVGDIRQPRLSADYNYLNNLLAKLGVNQPYTLNRDQYKVLMKEKGFSDGSRGLQAELPIKDYVYRLSSVEKLPDYAEHWELDEARHFSVQEIFEYLLSKQLATRQWVPFKDIAKGKYCSKRNFIFWAFIDISSDIFASANMLGLTANLITEHSVVLRFPINRIDIHCARIPTIIDAIDQVIFLPADEELKPRTGLTINIGNRDRIEEGTDEIVIAPLDIDYIELLPVHVDTKSKYRIVTNFNPVFLKLLIDFYRSVGEVLF